VSSLRLPPLNALKAFDAVVRHMSFTKAAKALFVTPAALSYQIKQLEEHLGVKLFNRLNRSIELTSEGKLLAPGIEQGFDQFYQALQLLQKKRSGNVLVISAGPAFTAKWLAPRLYRFMTQYPKIDARISASLILSNLTTDDVDVAIRFGGGNYPQYQVAKLFDDYLVPLCSPQFLAQHGPITLSNLQRQTLIYDDTHVDQRFSIASWQQWFEQMGVTDFINKEKAMHFNVADHALNAAAAGAGIVLGRQALAQNDIDAGRLVVAFDHKIKVDYSYYVLNLAERADEPHIHAFIQWLHEEINGEVDLSLPQPIA
jgi:LysR family glycine cleavage system transcriptional activator